MISISSLFGVENKMVIEEQPIPTASPELQSQPEVPAEPIQSSVTSLTDIFPDLPDTTDPCVLAEFFIEKCDEFAQGIPSEQKVTQVPEPSEPGGRASIPVEITPKGLMPAG